MDVIARSIKAGDQLIGGPTFDDLMIRSTAHFGKAA